jgi:hypothetical protein
MMNMAWPFAVIFMAIFAVLIVFAGVWFMSEHARSAEELRAANLRSRHTGP